MKRIVLCSAVALSLVGIMIVAYRGNEESSTVMKYDNRDYDDTRDYDDSRYDNRYRRGPVRGTVHGAVNTARGTGHAVGHGIKNIFGVRHRGYNDEDGVYHE